MNELEEKKALLNEMLSLSEQQSEFIKSEEIKEIQKILDEKDLIIAKINELDSKFYSNSEGLIEEHLSSELIKINEILNKIKVLDDANNKELSKSMTGIQDGLKEVREGKRVMNNYSNSDPYHAFASQGGTLFIDQDS